MKVREYEPTFGVVITSYNRPDFLLLALESVVAQYTPAHDIVIVDDCSDFDVNELLSKYSYLPLKIVTKPRGKGASHSRNLGLQITDSDYVAFLDDDDVFLPNRLSKAKQCFKEHPHSVACLSSYLFMDGSQRKKVPDKGWVDQAMLRDGNPYCGTSGLVMKTNYARTHQFDEEVPSGEDWELFARLSQGGGFFFDDTPTFLYRTGGHVSKTNAKKSLRITQVEKRFVAAKKQRRWLGEDKYKQRIAKQILGDLGTKKHVWSWISYSFVQVGFSTTLRVLCQITTQKISNAVA